MNITSGSINDIALNVFNVQEERRVDGTSLMDMICLKRRELAELYQRLQDLENAGPVHVKDIDESLRALFMEYPWLHVDRTNKTLKVCLKGAPLSIYTYDVSKRRENYSLAKTYVTRNRFWYYLKLAAGGDIEAGNSQAFLDPTGLVGTASLSYIGDYDIEAVVYDGDTPVGKHPHVSGGSIRNQGNMLHVGRQWHSDRICFGNNRISDVRTAVKNKGEVVNLIRMAAHWLTEINITDMYGGVADPLIMCGGRRRGSSIHASCMPKYTHAIHNVLHDKYAKRVFELMKEYADYKSSPTDDARRLDYTPSRSERHLMNFLTEIGAGDNMRAHVADILTKVQTGRDVNIISFEDFVNKTNAGKFLVNVWKVVAASFVITDNIYRVEEPIPQPEGESTNSLMNWFVQLDKNYPLVQKYIALLVFFGRRIAAHGNLRGVYMFGEEILRLCNMLMTIVTCSNYASKMTAKNIVQFDMLWLFLGYECREEVLWSKMYLQNDIRDQVECYVNNTTMIEYDMKNHIYRRDDENYYGDDVDVDVDDDYDDDDEDEYEDNDGDEEETDEYREELGNVGDIQYEDTPHEESTEVRRFRTIAQLLDEVDEGN